MVSHKEIRVRQFIWSQFRSGKTEQETLESARSKFSADAVSAEMIDMWFARFKAGNNFILENDSVHAIQTLPTGEEVRALKYKYKSPILERSYSFLRICLKRHSL
jgi:hypothetical protein